MATKESPKKSELIFEKAYSEFQVRRKRFEDIDNDINESLSILLKSMVKVAEENPHEFFGIKPSPREVFILNKVLDPAFIKSFNEIKSEDDIIGSQDGVLDFLGDLAKGFLKKIDLIELIKQILEIEKPYWYGQNKADGNKAEYEQTRERGRRVGSND